MAPLRLLLLLPLLATGSLARIGSGIIDLGSIIFGQVTPDKIDEDLQNDMYAVSGKILDLYALSELLGSYYLGGAKSAFNVTTAARVQRRAPDLLNKAQLETVKFPGGGHWVEADSVWGWNMTFGGVNGTVEVWCLCEGRKECGCGTAGWAMEKHVARAGKSEAVWKISETEWVVNGTASEEDLGMQRERKEGMAKYKAERANRTAEEKKEEEGSGGRLQGAGSWGVAGMVVAAGLVL